MDKTMFMAFATEFEEYQGRVYKCVEAIKKGVSTEEALEYYEVEYSDVRAMINYCF